MYKKFPSCRILLNVIKSPRVLPTYIVFNKKKNSYSMERGYFAGAEASLATRIYYNSTLVYIKACTNT